MKERIVELERENETMLKDIRALWDHNQKVKKRLQEATTTRRPVIQKKLIQP